MRCTWRRCRCQTQTHGLAPVSDECPVCGRIEPLAHRRATAVLQWVVFVVVGAVGMIDPCLPPGGSMVRDIDVSNCAVLFGAIRGDGDVVPDRHNLALVVGERGLRVLGWIVKGSGVFQLTHLHRPRHDPSRGVAAPGLLAVQLALCSGWRWRRGTAVDCTGDRAGARVGWGVACVG